MHEYYFVQLFTEFLIKQLGTLYLVSTDNKIESSSCIVILLYTLSEYIYERVKLRC
jgi:hypothetical protein